MEEELAEARVQLKLCRVSFSEKDEEMQELTRQVLSYKRKTRGNREQVSDRVL